MHKPVCVHFMKPFWNTSIPNLLAIHRYLSNTWFSYFVYLSQKMCPTFFFINQFMFLPLVFLHFFLPSLVEDNCVSETKLWPNRERTFTQKWQGGVHISWSIFETPLIQMTQISKIWFLIIRGVKIKTKKKNKVILCQANSSISDDFWSLPFSSLTDSFFPLFLFQEVWPPLF